MGMILEMLGSHKDCMPSVLQYLGRDAFQPCGEHQAGWQIVLALQHVLGRNMPPLWQARRTQLGALGRELYPTGLSKQKTAG